MKPDISFKPAPQNPTEAQHNNALARIIAVSSGKGGVGKSSISLNLAVELSRQGQKVCIFDADTNLANINIMTGLNPGATLHNLIEGDKSLHDILLKGPGGINIVPAASGLTEFVNLTAAQQQRLEVAISELETDHDVIVVDTAAGISESVLGFVQTSTELVLCITTEPTSLTDAFSLLKVMRQRGIEKPLRVLVNKAPDYDIARETLVRFSGALKKYLGLRVSHPGYILEDRNVPRSIMVQQPYTLMYPRSPASRCIRHFSERLLTCDTPRDGDFQALMEQLKQLPVTNDNHADKHKGQPFAWLQQALQSIQQAPMEEVTPALSQIADHWLKRVAQEHKDKKNFDDQYFKSAAHFASLIKKTGK